MWCTSKYTVLRENPDSLPGPECCLHLGYQAMCFSFHSLCLARLALNILSPLLPPGLLPYCSVHLKLVCSSSLADAFMSSHFLPRCYFPKAAFWSADLNATCMGYSCACLPRAYVIWNFPLIYLLVYNIFFLLPPMLHLFQEEKF